MTKAKTDSTKRKKRERTDSPPPLDPCVMVHVELWDESNGLATTSAAVLLVNDLLLAEGALLCESSGSSLFAKLPDADRAVIATGHLHSAMEGFSQARKEGRISYVCLLNKAEMPRPEIETPASNSLAGGLESGTVLIAGVLCDAMRLLPGVMLRPLDRAPRSAALANQQIAEMLRPPEFAELLRDVSIRYAPAAEDQGHSKTTGAKAFGRNAKAGFLGQKRYWTIGGTAAACLLAAAASIAVLAKRSPHAAAAPAADTMPSPKVKTAPTPPIAAPSAAGPISTVSKIKEGAPSHRNTDGEKQQPDATRELPKKPEKAKPDARGRTTSPGGAMTFDRSEIPRMNAMAERAAGDGNYDRAITIFESVLRNDPNNSEARRELEKAQRNKGSQPK